MSNESESTHRTIWLNFDECFEMLKEVDDTLCWKTLRVISRHLAKTHNLVADKTQGGRTDITVESNRVGFHLCTKEVLEAKKELDRWNSLSEKQKAKELRWKKDTQLRYERIYSGEYLASTEPWGLLEWRAYNSRREKGKSYIGAPVNDLDLGGAYLVDADLRGCFRRKYPEWKHEGYGSRFDEETNLEGALLKPSDFGLRYEAFNWNATEPQWLLISMYHRRYWMDIAHLWRYTIHTLPYGKGKQKCLRLTRRVQP